MKKVVPNTARWAAVDRWTLGLLLFAAAVLRLSSLELVSITQDEGIHGIFARNTSLLLWEYIPIVGLPSVGVRNSALFVYLLAAPNFIYRHPLSGVAFVAAMNILAVAMTYRLAIGWFGRTAAVVACLLLTFSPWAVLYARNMWPPSALMPFCLLLLHWGVSWSIQGGDRRLFRMILIAFIIPQIHFSGFCAPAWALCTIVLGAGRLNGVGAWKAITAGVALGVSSWAPWIYWQHNSNHWQDVRQVLQAVKGKSDFSAYAVFDYYQCMLHSGRLDYWFRTAIEELPEFFPIWLPPLLLVAKIVLLVAFALGVWHSRRSATGRLLLAWSVIPVVLLFALRPLVHPHYVLIAFPGPFLLAGAWCQAWAICNLRRTLLAASLLLIAAAHTTLMLGWRAYLADDRLDGGDRYQLSYRQRRAAALSILDDNPGRQFDLAGPFSGQQPAYHYPFLYELYLRSRGKWKMDAAHLYWIDEEKGELPPPNIAGDVLKYSPYLARAIIEKQWRVGPSRIFKLRGDPQQISNTIR